MSYHILRILCFGVFSHIMGCKDKYSRCPLLMFIHYTNKQTNISKLGQFVTYDRWWPPLLTLLQLKESILVFQSLLCYKTNFFEIIDHWPSTHITLVNATNNSFSLSCLLYSQLAFGHDTVKINASIFYSYASHNWLHYLHSRNSLKVTIWVNFIIFL